MESGLSKLLCRVYEFPENIICESILSSMEGYCSKDFIGLFTDKLSEFNLSIKKVHDKRESFCLRVMRDLREIQAELVINSPLDPTKLEETVYKLYNLKILCETNAKIIPGELMGDILLTFSQIARIRGSVMDELDITGQAASISGSEGSRTSPKCLWILKKIVHLFLSPQINLPLTALNLMISLCERTQSSMDSIVSSKNNDKLISTPHAVLAANFYLRLGELQSDDRITASIAQQLHHHANSKKGRANVPSTIIEPELIEMENNDKSGHKIPLIVKKFIDKMKSPLEISDIPVDLMRHDLKGLHHILRKKMLLNAANSFSLAQDFILISGIDLFHPKLHQLKSGSIELISDANIADDWLKGRDPSGFMSCSVWDSVIEMKKRRCAALLGLSRLLEALKEWKRVIQMFKFRFGDSSLEISAALLQGAILSLLCDELNFAEFCLDNVEQIYVANRHPSPLLFQLRKQLNALRGLSPMSRFNSKQRALALSLSSGKHHHNANRVKSEDQFNEKGNYGEDNASGAKLLELLENENDKNSYHNSVSPSSLNDNLHSQKNFKTRQELNPSDALIGHEDSISDSNMENDQSNIQQNYFSAMPPEIMSDASWISLMKVHPSEELDLSLSSYLPTIVLPEVIQALHSAESKSSLKNSKKRSKTTVSPVRAITAALIENSPLEPQRNHSYTGNSRNINNKGASHRRSDSQHRKVTAKDILLKVNSPQRVPHKDNNTNENLQNYHFKKPDLDWIINAVLVPNTNRTASSPYNIDSLEENANSHVEEGATKNLDTTREGKTELQKEKQPKKSNNKENPSNEIYKFFEMQKTSKSNQVASYSAARKLITDPTFGMKCKKILYKAILEGDTKKSIDLVNNGALSLIEHDNNLKKKTKSSNQQQNDKVANQDAQPSPSQPIEEALVNNAPDPLFLAAFIGRSSILNALLKEGADPLVMTSVDSDQWSSNLRVTFNDTPVHCAASKGHTQCLQKLLSALANCSDVDVLDGKGRTPLWRAAAALETDSVRILLDSGAKSTARQVGTGNTILHACLYGYLLKKMSLRIGSSSQVNEIQKKAREIVFMLLESGARPTSKNARDRSCLDLSVKMFKDVYDEDVGEAAEFLIGKDCLSFQLNDEWILNVLSRVVTLGYADGIGVIMNKTLSQFSPKLVIGDEEISENGDTDAEFEKDIGYYLNLISNKCEDAFNNYNSGFVPRLEFIIVATDAITSATESISSQLLQSMGIPGRAEIFMRLELLADTRNLHDDENDVNHHDGEIMVNWWPSVRHYIDDEQSRLRDLESSGHYTWK